MRLLNTQTYEFEEFFDSERPPYAILSHTWGVHEVNLQEWEQWQQGDAGTRAWIQAKRGFKKIKKACGIARKGIPRSNTNGEPERNTKDPPTGYRYLWVDTNCINKDSSAELSEAINSMFNWYQSASFCIVYLEDIGAGSNTVLAKSRWFTRGWTLQELIAPPCAENVIFYGKKWHPIGSRAQLCDVLTSITGISQKVLLEPGSYRKCSVAQRMSWASKRTTTKKEDMAYCLLGLFDITMTLVYSATHKDLAFMRLQEEILKVSTDQTMFAWDYNESHKIHADLAQKGMSTMLAPDPSYFRDCGNVVETDDAEPSVQEFTLTNVGLTMTLRLVSTHDIGVVYAALNCTHEGNSDTRICVPLTTMDRAGGRPDARLKPSLGRNPYHLPSLLSIDKRRIPEQFVKICNLRMHITNWCQLTDWQLHGPHKSKVVIQLFPANVALREWTSDKCCYGPRDVYPVPSPSNAPGGHQEPTMVGCFLEFRRPTLQEHNKRRILVITWSGDFSRTRVRFRKLCGATDIDGENLFQLALRSPSDLDDFEPTMDASSNTAAWDDELNFEVDFTKKRQMIEVEAFYPDRGGFMLPVYMSKTALGPKPHNLEEQQVALWRPRGSKRQRESSEEGPVECEI